MEKAVIDFPQPDSPTSPTTSPRPTLRETPSTTRTAPVTSAPRISVTRSRTSSRSGAPEARDRAGRAAGTAT